ncbi:MAG: hypothetical protein ACO2ZJ_11195, partial [Pseudohongiellaceae bacterium]
HLVKTNARQGKSRGRIILHYAIFAFLKFHIANFVRIFSQFATYPDCCYPHFPNNVALNIDHIFVNT